VEEIVDQLQQFLTAPEESGLRLKRSTGGEWDKEFDLSTLGVLFQLKYINPANPFEGGRAHVMFPGAKFISNAPFDNMDLDIDFAGGDAIDGLFDMKVNYKFIQKFTFLADRPQEGSFAVYRKFEGGMWKTRVTVDNNNKVPHPFLDVAVESDRQTKLNAIFNFEEDNKWEFKAVRVPGQSINLELLVNGHKYTGVGTIDMAAMKLNLRVTFEAKVFNLDFDLNPAGEWGIHVTGDVDGPIDAKFTMQKDFKLGEINVQYKDQKYAYMQLKGEGQVEGFYPKLFDYVLKYNIQDSVDHQGKAKLKIDARAPAKKFEMSFAPKVGKPFTAAFEFDVSSGLKYKSELKIDGAVVEKWVGEHTWTNDAAKFELDSKDTFEQTKENPFYHFNNKYFFLGREAPQAIETRKVFINKQASLPQVKVDTKCDIAGVNWYHLQYDNIAPKKALLFSFLPYNMEKAWTYEGHRQNTANGGMTFDHKITHGEKVIQTGEFVFDVKENSPAKFEMEHVNKMTMTEESPFYALSHWYTGRYGKTVERKMTIVFDKVAKSILFFPKVAVNSVLTVDGVKNSEFVFDNTQAKKHFKFYYSPDAFSQDYLFEEEWEYPGMSGVKFTQEYKRGGVSQYHYDADWAFVNNAAKFEIKTQDKVVQTENSPFYSWGPIFQGKYWKTGERVRTITYDKKNKNFLIGKTHAESLLTLDGERFHHIKFDTTATPYTLVWYSQPIRSLEGWMPCVRDVIGQDELSVTAKHTPGAELMIETNLSEMQSVKVTTVGATRKFELNGNELATIDFDSSAKTASHTMQLPSGKTLTVNLAWPKMTPQASDLEFGVIITPDRQVTTKFGWKMGGKNSVYMDVVGNNPWIGDYKLSRKGEFEQVNRNNFKVSWTGHGETSKGFLRSFSPVETHIVAAVNTNNLKVDANVWKSFAGMKYGFTMNNDKFELLSGRA